MSPFRLLFRFLLRPGQPQVRDAVDLPGADQLLILSPFQGPKELLTPGLSLLLRSAVGRRVSVKLVPHDPWSTIRTVGPSGAIGSSTPSSAKTLISTRFNRNAAAR